ncbi:MAG: 5' nucleotidase, NT5C type [Acidimicrobiales bacterium]
MLIGLDLDGVLCDLGPGVATRIAARFGLATHPATWRSYDLRRLQLGLPADRFGAFLDEIFAEPALYGEAPATCGAVAGVGRLRAAGHEVVGITARPRALGAVTTSWLSARGLVLDAVHHTPVGTKATVAASLGVDATVEDNPVEAELLAEVCRSYLLDHSYNRDVAEGRAVRIFSWDDLVGRLCQLRLFA